MPCPQLLCSPTLPLDRIVRVTIDDQTLAFNDNCRQMVMLLSDDAGLKNINALPADPDFNVPYLDAANRVRVFGTLNEVATHYAHDSEVYKAASIFFQQAHRASVFKIGYRDFTAPESMVEALDKIIQCDDCWNILVTTQFLSTANGGDAYTGTGQISDTAQLDAVSEWAQAHRKLYFIDSWDAGTKDPNNTTNITWRLGEIGMSRTAVFWHEGWCEPILDAAGTEIGTYTKHPYLSMYQAAYSASVDFDSPNSMFTAKFKNVTGVRPSRVGSDVVTAVTGFIPGIGMQDTAGHFANMYVKFGSYPIIVEGTTVSGAFIATIQALDFMAVKVQNEVFDVLRTHKIVPNTDRGMGLITAKLLEISIQAVNAGIISDDFGDDFPDGFDADGNFLGAFSISHQRPLDIPRYKRAQGIAPQINLCFRVAMPIHFVDIVLCARS